MLPTPPYANLNMLLEHNIYKVPTSDGTFYFVKVLGVVRPYEAYLRGNSGRAAQRSICSSFFSVKFMHYWRYVITFLQGIKFDPESWYSITPQVAAEYTARLCIDSFAAKAQPLRTVMDWFCGCGGNTIAFATADAAITVIGVDIDAIKLSHLRHNAGIYGVADRPVLLWEDVYAVADKYFAPLEGEGCEDGGELGDLLAGGATVDLVVMSPPWGGPDYSLSEEFDLRSMLSCGGDGDGFRLLKEAIRIAKNVVYVLPRNTKLKQLKELAAE
eukprot:gene28070-31198_t